LSRLIGLVILPGMRTPLVFLLACGVAIFAGCAATTPSRTQSAAPQAKLTPLGEARLAEAQLLANERRFADAAVIYEEQCKLRPEDGELFARYASMLSKEANAEVDPEKARPLNKHARALAEKAEKFGTTNPMPQILLASIRPDGSTVETPKGTFSSHEEVEQLIRDGETAFRQNNLVKAREYYQKAFELEPTNYMAALWTGDAYFSARELEPACEWFRKAVAIDPDRETAHRYLGDALGRLGHPDQALEEHIAALLCEPYLRTTRQHFTPEQRARAEAQGHRIPRFPDMRSTVEGKQINLAVNPDDGLLIMAYNICAMGWRSKDFAEHFPNEKTLRRSVLEEIYAIDAMLETAQCAKEPDTEAIKKWQSAIDGLITLKKDGLLEAYAFFERADQGLAKDYANYRADHREQLERYIRIYWCGLK
jgi:tetratricopeptide (TPR) repeat protein